MLTVQNLIARIKHKLLSIGETWANCDDESGKKAQCSIATEVIGLRSILQEIKDAAIELTDEATATQAHQALIETDPVQLSLEKSYGVYRIR